MVILSRRQDFSENEYEPTEPVNRGERTLKSQFYLNYAAPLSRNIYYNQELLLRAMLLCQCYPCVKITAQGRPDDKQKTFAMDILVCWSCALCCEWKRRAIKETNWEIGPDWLESAQNKILLNNISSKDWLVVLEAVS